MRLSKTFFKTLREAPKDEIARNGALLSRAGYIHKEMAGIYDYLPLGLIVIDKIKQIIREELNGIGTLLMDVIARMSASETPYGSLDEEPLSHIGIGSLCLHLLIGERGSSGLTAGTRHIEQTLVL